MKIKILTNIKMVKLNKYLIFVKIPKRISYPNHTKESINKKSWINKDRPLTNK